MKHPIRITRDEVQMMIEDHSGKRLGRLLGESWQIEASEASGDLYTTPAAWTEKGKAIYEEMGAKPFIDRLVKLTIMRAAVA